MPRTNTHAAVTAASTTPAAAPNDSRGFAARRTGAPASGSDRKITGTVTGRYSELAQRSRRIDADNHDCPALPRHANIWYFLSTASGISELMMSGLGHRVGLHRHLRLKISWL